MMNERVPVDWVKLPVWLCLHCQHRWTGKNENAPTCCAGCKSPNWFKPKQEGKGRPKAEAASEPPAGPSESPPDQG